jgi:hypothetical protein
LECNNKERIFDKTELRVLEVEAEAIERLLNQKNDLFMKWYGK